MAKVAMAMNNMAATRQQWQQWMTAMDHAIAMAMEDMTAMAMTAMAIDGTTATRQQQWQW